MGRVSRYFDKFLNYETFIFSLPLIGKLKKMEIESIKKTIDIKDNEAVLDAGCGTGIYSYLAKSLGARVVGVDLSKKMVKETLKKGVNAIVGDLQNIGFLSQFDKILCIGVLEFCSSPSIVIENLSSSLKNDGEMILLIPLLSPFGLGYKLYHLFMNQIHINLFTLGKIKRLLNKSGLKISEIKIIWGFSTIIKARKKWAYL